MRRSPLLIIYMTVFLDLLGFGIILPLLPFYAEQFGATGIWVGALLTAYSAAQIVGAAFLGRLSDRVGRRPVLLLSLLGSALSLTVTGFAGSLLVLLAGRALAGLFGGSIGTAQAYIADLTKPEERAKYMGLLGASIGMGFVLGPAIGAALSQFGFGTAAFVAAALCFANFVFAVLRLPESRQPGATLRPRASLTLTNFVDALQHPSVGRILISTFLVTFAFVGMEATAALFGEHRLGLTSSGLGIGFAFIGVIIVVVQGGLIGRLVKRYGERTIAATGGVLMAVALLLIPLIPGLVFAAVVVAVLAVGQGLSSPTLSTLLSREADADEQGGTLGMGQSLSALARAVGPLVAGALFDLGEGLPFYLGAVLCLIAAWQIRSYVVLPKESATPAESAAGR